MVNVETPVAPQLEKVTYYRYIPVDEAQRRANLTVGTEKQLQQRILGLDHVIERECRPAIAALRKQLKDAGIEPNG